MHRSSLALVTAAILAAALGWTPTTAHACGGTFCDGGNPMPVDQTGEDILFIRDGDEMEVHVRIQYTGGPERFAWMVPLPAVPEVSVGTEALFVQLGAATIPNWTTAIQYEDPDEAPPPPGGGGVFVPDDSPSEPEVVYDDTVGAFEVVVLQAASAAEVLEFFDANNYSFEPDAEPIIQQYIDEGFLITGVKLTAGASTETIHPLVFRFTSDEPCVPIRLTAVAAQQDMGVRAYFLAQERWAPSNYAHVVLNPAAYDWTNAGIASYLEVLSLAVDEAGGHAFATDYSGPSGVVATQAIWQPGWSTPDWAGLTALEAIMELESLGLLFNVPPQLRLILREYVPPPPDYEGSEDDFWQLYFIHPELIDTPAWDPAGFAADFDELVVEPGMHAVDMLEAWPTLTRLHTTLSPHEMTVDPIFHPAPDLPAVANTRAAQAFVFAGETWARYALPFELDGDGMVAQTERVCVEGNGSWPEFSGLTPRALRIEQAPMMGPMQVVTDNEAEILALIAAHNEGSPCEQSPGDGDGDGDGDPSGETGDDGPGADDAGGGCEVAPVGAGGLLGFGLALLGLVRRRRAE